MGNVHVTQITGFISAEKQMYDYVVQDWLRHPDIFNLELTAIAYRHTNEKIRTFLDESELADHGDHHSAHGLRLRVDMCKASAAPR